MKKYQNGSVGIVLLIIFVLLIVAFFYFYKKTSTSEIINADSTISYAEICNKVSDFISPACIQAVAIYNNDKTICENISLNPGVDGGTHNADFKKSCIEVIETGTVLDKKFELNKEISFGKADSINRENSCRDVVVKAGKIFIPSEIPWNKSSLNGYMGGDEKSSVLILTCSGF